MTRHTTPISAAEPAVASRPAGLLLAALILLAAAAPSPAWEPPKFTPEQMGGTLRGNFSAEPRTLNPITTKDQYGEMLIGFIFETLIERDVDTLEWRGVLADKWEVSADGLTLTFHLDPRGKFSDGKPVTADDVVFTYQTVMNPKIDARALASYYEDCQGCEKVDERTVRFVWRKPYFKTMEFSGGGFPILPKHVYAFTDPDKFNNLSDLLVGTGPYKFTEWKTGQQIVLTRNENYWREPVAFDRIVFRVIIESQAAVQAMRAGDLDYLAIPAEWWVKLQEDKAVAERFQWFRYTAPGAGYGFIAWNNARAPFNDKRVRRAMTQLVWREQLLKYLNYDIGTLTTGPFWPPSPQYDHSVKPWPFDREAARALLKEAGWEDRAGEGWLTNEKGKRFQFELSYPQGDQQTRDFIRVLTEEFRRMGIEMNSRAYTWAVFTTKLDNRDFDAIRLGWGGGGIEEDPYQIWDSKSIVDQGSNFVGFRNAEADRLIETARMTLDVAKRTEMYHQFHRLVHEEQPYTFLWSPDSLRMFSLRVKGLKVHKLGMVWHEWWMGKEEAEKEKQGP